MKNESCPKKYRLDSTENDHKAAAFILLRGLWQAENFRFAITDQFVYIRFALN
jgi:hypothetical protein